VELHYIAEHNDTNKFKITIPTNFKPNGQTNTSYKSKEKKNNYEEGGRKWIFLFSIFKSRGKSMKKDCDFHPGMEDIEKK